MAGAIPLARRALAAARFGNFFTIETLVSVAAVGAIAINEAPEGAVVVFFFMIGEWLEGISAGRARAGIKALASLAPKTALLIHSGGDGAHASEHTDEIPAERLTVGQLVLVPLTRTIRGKMGDIDEKIAYQTRKSRIKRDPNFGLY